MGISSLLASLQRLVRRHDVAEDPELDRWIRDALLDDARAHPPAAAWDRLRRAIIDRRSHRYGMWVLDVAQNEPRRASHYAASRGQAHVTVRGQGISLEDYKWGVREAMWGTMLPTFSALMNL